MAEYKDVEQLKKQIADFKRAVNSVKPMNSDYLTGYISALSAVEGAIAEQPTADVAPVRHGQWVKEKKDVLIHWHCSACRECYFLEEPNAKYCPHCGARMGGDADANSNDNKTPET